MYRSVLALLFASVLLLGGCAAQQQTVPKEKNGQETNMDGLAFDRSDEEITYMDTTENVIYLAGGCFWGMEQLMQSIPGVIDAESGYANGTREATEQAAKYCRAVYEAGFSPICPTLYQPLFLNDAVPEEHKSGIDMGRDLLRRSHVLVVCGSISTESMKNDVAVAQRLGITATTLDGILTVKRQGRR